MTRPLLRSACAAWLLMGAIVAHALELPAGTSDCLAVLERASTPPEERALLGDVCPSIADALIEGGWGALLDATSPHALDAPALSRLISVTDRYRLPEPAGPELSAQPLHAIVAELAPFEVAPEPSLWTRVLQWMEQWLATEGQNGLLDWLREITIPDQWARAAVWIAGATIVLGALVVVLVELWHGGVLSRRRRKSIWRRTGAAPGDSAPPPPGLSRLDGLPAARQPVVLLALIVERLRRLHAERFGPSATHRELVAAAEDLEGEKLRAFEGVAAAAERITFGDWHPRPGEVAEVIRGGRLLLSQLPENETSEERA